MVLVGTPTPAVMLALWLLARWVASGSPLSLPFPLYLVSRWENLTLLKHLVGAVIWLCKNIHQHQLGGALGYGTRGSTGFGRSWCRVGHRARRMSSMDSSALPVSWAGRASCALYTISAEETLLSSFGETQRPSSTYGWCWRHLAEARRARRVSFSWLCRYPVHHAVALRMVGCGG